MHFIIKRGWYPIQDGGKLCYKYPLTPLSPLHSYQLTLLLLSILTFFALLVLLLYTLFLSLSHHIHFCFFSIYWFHHQWQSQLLISQSSTERKGLRPWLRSPMDARNGASSRYIYVYIVNFLLASDLRSVYIGFRYM